MVGQYRLETVGVSKTFPGVKALDDIDLKVRPGTVHALMGESGVGKSTLMKCLFGIYKMGEGQIFTGGEKVEITSPNDILHKGLVVVHQELQPIPGRSITESMYLDRYPMKGIGPFRMVDHKVMSSGAEKWLRDVKMNSNPKTKLGTLSIGQMQSVGIVRAVSQSAKLTILGEPTSSLVDSEVEVLFRIIRSLKTRGVFMIYVSHKMAGIRQIADDTIIVCDGTYVDSWEVEDISDDEIVKQMVGRELTSMYLPKDGYGTEETAFKADRLCGVHERSFQDCSFELKCGEILGFGRLVSAQRIELMEAILGMCHITSGQVEISSKKAAIRRPQDTVHDSVGIIAEDHRGTGTVGCLSIEDNTVIAFYSNYIHPGKIDKKKMDEVMKGNIAKLSIKTPSGRILIQSLSGDNQQKVIMARQPASNPDILIMDEPIRGIDVSAKCGIYRTMIDLVRQGESVIMISSETLELIGMFNRIIVICNGHITGELEGGETTQERVTFYTTQFDLQGKSKSGSEQEA